MKALLYCTRAKPYLVYGCVNKYTMTYAYDTTYSEEIKNNLDCFNGKVIGECDFDIEEIKLNEYEYADFNNSPYFYSYFETETLQEADLCKQSCLTDDELGEYLDLYNEKEIYGYAIHIKNLKVFDIPSDLSEYSKKVEHCKCDECLKHCKNYYAKNNITQTTNTGCTKYTILYKAPQNMMYVFDLEEKKVLISIHPKELCKILNGEKTIDVRKKVLKEMIK